MSRHSFKSSTTNEALNDILNQEDKLFSQHSSPSLNSSSSPYPSSLQVPPEDQIKMNRPAAVNSKTREQSHITKGKLEDICNYMIDGLKVEEAAMLAGVSPKELAEDRQKFPMIDATLTRKVLLFKQKHLKIVGMKKDEKTSQWLLEKLFPKEFGSKPQNNVQVNIIEAMIKEIQKRDQIPVKIYEQESNNRPVDRIGEAGFGIDQILQS